MWEKLWILTWQYRSGWFVLYHTNLSHKVPLSFVWLKFSSFGWDIDMKRIRSDKTLRLGITKAPQVNIQGISKQLSLGMPRKASPLSSSTLSVTSLGTTFLFVTWYVFCLERHFLLLGFACCYLQKYFASFFSIKMSIIAFAMLILQVYMLLFQKRKFVIVAKIPEKSQNVIKCWIFFAQ